MPQNARCDEGMPVSLNAGRVRHGLHLRRSGGAALCTDESAALRMPVSGLSPHADRRAGL